MATQNQTTHLTDAIFTEIIARLPLRVIARFKLDMVMVAALWAIQFYNNGSKF
ncbi:unnamed protein product, partial [Arabidopsis halleri]